ncbi:ADP-ribose pyrophosphatase [Phycisphaerales bacterium]|nr:ADP-ribose pyrophosphatase [Phycisphaerales bacterium]
MTEESLEIEIIARGILFHEEHVLLCRSLKGGYSYLPGGHVDFGESAQAALRREFLEETGLSVRVLACALIHENVFRQAGRLRHEFNVVFHVEHVGPPNPPGTGPNPVPSLEPKIAFDWVPLASLKSCDVRPSQHAEWLSVTAADVNPRPPVWISTGFDT